MFSRTTIIGRVGKDASITFADGGSQAINFSVCVNRKRPTSGGGFEDNPVWYQCVQWVRAGESVQVAGYILKGHVIHVEGEVRAEPFLDKNGQPQATLRLKVEKITLIPQQSA